MTAPAATTAIAADIDCAWALADPGAEPARADVRIRIAPDGRIATLDAPGRIAPEFHIFWASKVAWFDPGDDLPRFDRFRPYTRGLDGTDPPD